jgi:4a-hydroxytetrahydrobiopterin dehydratase
MSNCNLNDKSCKPCESETSPLNDNEITKMLTNINQWQITEDKKSIYKDFKFKGFYKTIAFVNAIAWIANKEGHHPDLKVGYNYCQVLFTTHAIAGLSENDFICAAKIDML